MCSIPYLLFKTIRDNLLDADGIIFGGAVRDMLIHDNAAKSFYATNYLDKDYADAAVHPESADRLLVPNNINVVFYTAADFDNFHKNLKASGLQVIGASTPEVSEHESSDALLPFGWYHAKAVIGFSLPEVLQAHISNLPTFSMDIIRAPYDILSSSKRPLPPFATPDFSCNALALFRVGGNDIITINESVYKAANLISPCEYALSIIQFQVLPKKAHYLSDTMQVERVKKIMAKGFSMESRLVIFYSKTDKLLDGDICLICHDALLESSGYAQLRCCQGKYHAKCIGIVMNQCTKCPQCRCHFKCTMADTCFIACMEKITKGVYKPEKTILGS